MPALLEVRDLTIRFGGIAALSDVSFDVPEGRVTGLIGPNGAGKTTCFNCITRLYQPSSGRILYKGEDLLRCPPQQIVRKRIARTFQNLALFDRMTVLENVLVGAHVRFPRAIYGHVEDAIVDEALALLDRFELRGVAHRPAAGLPFGTRKTVELARAVMARPELLLLDEPAAGLAHDEVSALGERIARLARELSLTVLMVEHHMQLVMRVSDHIVVLASGKTLADGPPQAIRDDPAVVEAYLGAV
ncbi:MAG TPA: ABC transporter ATP-binding protein [Candidatus Baltobacteraceae bacterium]|nr:ABC transporter ATP-binding protein [Candidatus Baltobacteraceae bacterium]